MPMHHHAVLFEGDREPALREAFLYVEKTLLIPRTKNPDFVHLEFERMTIDDARELKEQTAQTPFGHARAFILSCDSMLVETQHALLKVLEEPSAHTHIVLVLSNAGSLLPTVRSRLHHAGKFIYANVDVARATAFLTASPSTRMTMIQEFIEDKDRTKARKFIHELEHHLHDNGVGEHSEALKDLALASDYISDRSSSVKHILSHLAVVL